MKSIKIVVAVVLLFSLLQSDIVVGGRVNPKVNLNKYSNRINNNNQDEVIEYQTVPLTLFEKIFYNLISLYDHHTFNDDLSNEQNYYTNSKDDDKSGNDSNDNITNKNNKFNVHKIFNQFNQFIHAIWNQPEQQQSKQQLTLSQVYDIKNKKKQQELAQNNNNNINNNQQQQQQQQYSQHHSNSLKYTPSRFCSNIGILTYDSPLTNTCQLSSSIPCRPVTLICNNQTINVDVSTPVNPNTDYSQCQLLEMKCLINQPNDNINLKDQYKLNYCLMNMTCSTNLLWQCEIQNVVCDTSTTFNSQVFAYKCINEQLVCNGNVIPQNQFNNPTIQTQIQNGQCISQTIPCGPTDQCLDLNIDCSSGSTDCSLQIVKDTPCLNYCVRNLNTSSCDCPADYTSFTCNNPTPFTCNLQSVQPTPNCTGDMTLTTSPCFQYSLQDTASFSYYMSCHFTQPVDSSSDFSYWINLPNFKLSNPVQWQLKSDIINFYQLFSDFDNTTITSITKEQIMGQSLIWVNTTLSSIPANRWVSKRAYFEIGLVTPQINKTISRFYVNAVDYPDNSLASHVSTWKKTFIIVACTLISIALFIGALYIYNKKYRVKSNP